MEKLIGQGRLAKIYLKDGFAYKVFEEGYPLETVDDEIRVQEEIVKTGLPVVHYYRTDTPGVIRMDYIDGVTLSDRIWQENYSGGVKDLFRLQKEIHRAEGARLPKLAQMLPGALTEAEATAGEIDRALKYLAEIPDGERLCHLDLHFLNIMWRPQSGRYYIIDWASALLGNPVFDFARSYAILYEHAPMFRDEYLALLKGDGVDAEEFRKAVYIVALYRIRETGGDKMRELMADLPVIGG